VDSGERICPAQTLGRAVVCLLSAAHVQLLGSRAGCGMGRGVGRGGRMCLNGGMLWGWTPVRCDLPCAPWTSRMRARWACQHMEHPTSPEASVYLGEEVVCWCLQGVLGPPGAYVNSTSGSLLLLEVTVYACGDGTNSSQGDGSNPGNGTALATPQCEIELLRQRLEQLPQSRLAAAAWAPAGEEGTAQLWPWWGRA